MAQSNYDITLSRMPGEFLKYDQQRMIRMFCREYDAQYLSASVEKVQMTDGIMKTQWKDNVYRIILRLNDNYPMAKVKYRFVGTR